MNDKKKKRKKSCGREGVEELLYRAFSFEEHAFAGGEKEGRKIMRYTKVLAAVAVLFGMSSIIAIALAKLGNWDFGDAFLFVVTVFTTIGYGNIAPMSAGGKLVVLFTTLPLLSVSLITIVNIACPIVESTDYAHKWVLRMMGKRLPIQVTIPHKVTI